MATRRSAPPRCTGRTTWTGAVSGGRWPGRRRSSRSSPRPSPSSGSTCTRQLDFRYALLLTLIEVAAFRGLVDLLFRRFIESPSLFGGESEALRERGRRRCAAGSRSGARSGGVGRRRDRVDHPAAGLVLVFFGHGLTWGDDGAQGSGTCSRESSATRACSAQFVVLPFFFLFNFLIFFGPMMADGHLADPRLPARRRRVGRQARARPRPGRGEGGDPPDRLALAVGRALRARRRQARARPALPRRARAPARRCSPRRSRPASTRRS